MGQVKKNQYLQRNISQPQHSFSREIFIVCFEPLPFFFGESSKRICTANIILKNFSQSYSKYSKRQAKEMTRQ